MQGKLASAVRRGTDGKGSDNRDLAGCLPDSEGGRWKSACQQVTRQRPTLPLLCEEAEAARTELDPATLSFSEASAPVLPGTRLRLVPNILKGGTK